MNPSIQRAFAELIPPKLFAALPHLRLPPLRRPRRGTQGQYRDPRPGGAMEFREHRRYQPGDDPRRIDWRAAARRDETITRIQEGQSQRPLIAVLDLHAGMNYGAIIPDISATASATPQSSDRATRGLFSFRGATNPVHSDPSAAPPLREKWQLARGLAALWAYQSLQQENPTAIALAKSIPERRPPRPSKNPLATLDYLEELARCIPHAASELAPCLRALSQELHQPNIVVLISDWLDLSNEHQDANEAQDACFLALEALSKQGHTLVGIEVLHRDEVEFRFEGHPKHARFEDPRGRLFAVETDIARVRSAYLSALRAHRHELQQRADALSMRWLSLRSDGDWISQLQGTMRSEPDSPPLEQSFKITPSGEPQ